MIALLLSSDKKSIDLCHKSLLSLTREEGMKFDFIEVVNGSTLCQALVNESHDFSIDKMMLEIFISTPRKRPSFDGFHHIGQRQEMKHYFTVV